MSPDFCYHPYLRILNWLLTLVEPAGIDGSAVNATRDGDGGNGSIITLTLPVSWFVCKFLQITNTVLLFRCRDLEILYLGQAQSSIPIANCMCTYIRYYT